VRLAGWNGNSSTASQVGPVNRQQHKPAVARHTASSILDHPRYIECTEKGHVSVLGGYCAGQQLPLQQQQQHLLQWQCKQQALGSSAIAVVLQLVQHTQLPQTQHTSELAAHQAGQVVLKQQAGHASHITHATAPPAASGATCCDMHRKDNCAGCTYAN